MSRLSLVELGYNTIILDDYYSNLERAENGSITPNTTMFQGFTSVYDWTNQVKCYNVSVSPYSSNGYKTCAGFPGGYGHELQDLETWRSWGWTYMLKYDNCYIPYDNITMENEYGRFARMEQAIDQLAAKYNETPYIYSLCQWGWEDSWNWAPRISQAWRIDADIKPWWSALTTILELASRSYLSTNFYQHNDLDMLEVGNSGQGNPIGNLTYAEERTHFTAWCMLKSHLLIGTDLRNATNETISILTNKELIAINQDPNEGASIAPFRTGRQPDYSYIQYNDTNPPNYWAGNSTWGPIFMLINTADTDQTMTFNLTENWAVRAGREYVVRDLWAHRDVGTALRNWTVHLGPHDVAALLLKDAGPEPVGIQPPCGGILELQCTDSAEN